MVRITALMDDSPPARDGLIGEHGLSFYVEYGGSRLLFDCGQGPNAQLNAVSLGIDLKNLDAVILSHSHYDHAAGYRSLVENGMGSRDLYTGPGFFEPKYARKGTGCRDLSCGFGPEFLAEHRVTHHVTEGLRAIHPGVWLLSGFPRVHPFETIPDRFLRLGTEGFVPDDFGDEVCLALEMRDGLAVLAGCAHPGILNMVTQVSRVLKRPVKAVLGGAHLVEADEARISRTVDTLVAMGVELLGLSHCTGDTAESIIAARGGIRSCHLTSGDSLCLD